MGMIKRLDDNGDSALATWDPADTISTEEARKVFDALVADLTVGGLAQIEDATKNIARKVTVFDPQAEQIIVWNQVVGG